MLLYANNAYFLFSPISYIYYIHCSAPSFLSLYVLEILSFIRDLQFCFVFCIAKVIIFLLPLVVWPLVRLPLAPSPSHLSQEMLASLEAKQSESLSELITLRESLESSRLEGELLRQEQTEVTAALARVCRPPLTSFTLQAGSFMLFASITGLCFWALSLPMYSLSRN